MKRGSYQREEVPRDEPPVDEHSSDSEPHAGIIARVSNKGTSAILGLATRGGAVR